MLLRIRSPQGTSRLTVEASTPGDAFAQMLFESIPASEGADPASLTLSNQPGANGERVGMDALRGRQVGDMGFTHGDLLFLSWKPLAASAPASAAPSRPASTVATSTLAASSTTLVPKANLDGVVEPDIDVYWASQSGKIDRKRDAVFCRHGDKGMCDYCMPLEPYDAKYQAENQIKHLSFHAYLRKLLAGRAPSAISSNNLPPLDPLSLSVITPCPSGSHAPFPAGICSKCQPSALTLQSQPFRMVDHVEFATPELIDNLLGAWRRTGTQRFGFLIGKYDKYDKVPMGVKAVVEAVWEPKQEGELDGLTVEVPWSDEAAVKAIASWCEKGLGVVGMIYTDLTPDPEDFTKTMYKRHAQSFTASGLEMITSARYQIDHPLATLASPTGYFSSRWVTCCLTGTQDGQIDVIAWQATEQCEALVKANAIEASVDPSVVRVRKPKDGEYIPEVFYSYKNEYGLQVKNPAKPTFPVEYLMVSITHGFPNSPDPLFLSTAFPIENRPGLHDQSMEVVVRDLMKILQTSDLEVSDTATWPVRVKDQVAKWLSDWHLVAFLCMHGTFSADEQKLLAKVSTAHRHPEAVAVREHLFATSGWQTLLTIAESMAPAPAAQFDRMGIASPSRDSRPTSAFDSGPASGTGTNSGSPIVIPDDDDFPPIGGAGGSGSGSGDAGGPKACPHCTFINDAGATDCDVCGLPL